MNDLSHGERMIRTRDTDLCVETFGAHGHPAILLIDGAAASMLWWEADLCNRIAAEGRFVIRYDQRDTGRSTSFPVGSPGYSFTDLAEDAIAIIDALGVQRAHVVCRSMSGGTGLIIAVDHADRVATMTFVCTTTGGPDLPPPSKELASDPPKDPDPADPDSVVDFVVATAKAYAGGSPYFDEAVTRALVERDVARTTNLAAMLANPYAVSFDGPKGGGYGDIAAPTLVVQGDHDPLFPAPHGEALREAIPDAELLILEGAGHDVPRGVWDVFVPALIAHTGGTTAEAT